MHLVPKEVNLVMALIMTRQEVPKELKETALEKLQLQSMNMEAGTAEAYLMERLIKAVDTEDADEFHNIAKLIEKTYGFESDHDDNEQIEPVQEIVDMLKESIDAFVSSHDELPEAAKERALNSLHKEHDIISLRFEDNMLIAFSQEGECMIVYVFNEDDVTIDKVVPRWKKLDMKPVYHAIKEQWDVSEVKVMFRTLDIQMVGDHEFVLTSVDLNAYGGSND